ncbi:MAG TPA: hypothetical protein PLH64_01080 [Anaerolineaceae bacterium]|nr:hypothetical protein [Anaerolineaceae bacterium]
MRKQKALLILIIGGMLLSGCGQSERAIQIAIEQTQTAQPTPTTIPSPTPEPTPTKIPLQELKLSDIIFVQDKMPAGYTRAEITDETHPILEKSVVQPINSITQNLELKGEFGGEVSINLYETADVAQEVFEDIVFESPPMALLNQTSETNYDFGEQAYGLLMSIPDLSMYVILFVRCNAVVAIQVNSTDGYYGIQDYAKNLDGRLIEFVCR